MLRTTNRTKRFRRFIAVPILVAWALAAHAVGPLTGFAEAQERSRFSLESTLTYEHFSRNKVILRGVSFFDVIHIGEFTVNRMKRDVLTLSTRAAYDVSPRMRLEAVVPLRYRRELVALERDSDHAIGDDDDRVSRTREVQSAGLGDVEFKLHLALPPADISRTFSIAVKAPTGRAPYGLHENQLALGSGHWSTQLGLSLQKVIDPVVLFGSLGYTYSFGRVGTVGGYDGPQWITPGSSIRYTIGAGLAVNPRVAFTALLEHIHSRPARVGQGILRASEANSAVFNLGLRYQWLSGRVMHVQVGIGLTPDAPDFSVAVGLPLFR